MQYTKLKILGNIINIKRKEKKRYYESNTNKIII